MPATRTRTRPRGPTSPLKSADRSLRRPVGELRRRYGLSQLLLARLLDTSLRTLSAAESSAEQPPRLRRGLVQATRLCEALGEAMQPSFVAVWLDQPNDMLDGLKPIEAIERGQIDLVWQVVHGLRSGTPL